MDIRKVRYLWIIFLPLWIAALATLIVLLARRDGSLAIRIVAAICSAGFAFSAGYSIFQISPRIRALEQRSNQLHNFCEAIRKAASTLDLQEILDSASHIIVEVTGVRGCTIELLDPAGGKMEVKSVVGLDPDSEKRAVNLTENLYSQRLMHGESVIVRDAALRKFPSVNEQVESLICVPLKLEERILGAVCIYGEVGQKLSPQMISLLDTLGDVIALAIAHAFVYKDLENLVQTKTQFMFQTSHELRSPLNSIQSMARTLIDGYVGELNEKQREMLSRIDVRCQALSEVVGDLLRLAKGRAEVATLKLSEISLRDLVEEGCKLFEARAVEKGVFMEALMGSSDAHVLGNREGLFSIITNLLANAVKYTPSGGRVEVKLDESLDHIFLQVSDTGIGIPEAEQTRVFNEFYRADNAKSASAVGTGLGLAIVKSTVEQHGGILHLKSRVGEGTTFRIQFRKPPG